MEKEILKYIQDGITIEGNPKDGYSIFTNETQRFNISSLEELTPECFENAINDFKKREELQNEMFDNLDWNNNYINDKERLGLRPNFGEREWSDYEI